MSTEFNLSGFLSTPAAMQNAVKQIPCDMLHPYHNHPFELYTGERLEDMVESVRENGILSPIVVQPDDNGYEILIGHNRWNAAKIAGFNNVPAIVKEGLTENEAEIFVIESNVMQRGFDNLRISEQAAVIAQRHNEMFSQGKRNDIIRELQMLENPDTDNEKTTLNPLESKLDTSQNIGDEYGMSKGSVIRLVRINKLINELKCFIDNGVIAIRSGVELSFLSEQTQREIAELAEDYKIDMKKAEAIRKSADKDGNVSIDDIIRILDGKKKSSADKGKSVKISTDTFSRYFNSGAKAKDITDTVEKALAYYFEHKEEESE